MSQLGQYTDKVDRWHNSNQILRWTATGLMDIEPRLNKIIGFRYLPVLRIKLREIVSERLTKKSGEEECETAEVSMAGVGGDRSI